MSAKYNFPPIYKGDTFEKRQLEIKQNDVLVDLKDAVIDFVITNRNGTIVKKMNVSKSEQKGVLILDKWNVDIDDYNYKYQLQITINENTLTYMTGDFVVKNSFE